VKTLLENKYPGIEVIASHYPVSPLNALLAQVVTGTQMALIGTILVGGQLFANAAGGEENFPEWFKGLQQNKLGACVAVWFVGNLVGSGLSNTGAFDIAYDGELVFSKMNTGRMPVVQEIFSGIEAVRQRQISH